LPVRTFAPKPILPFNGTNRPINRSLPSPAVIYFHILDSQT
jgi:hypothetical protein